MRLGPITFRDFEVIAGVRFGGRQELITHRLGNGRRVIDVLGPEAANIRFAGTFSGQDALRRTQALDAIRKAGQPVELSWGTLRYNVILSRFDASYEMRAWIPYQAVCTVVQENLRGLGASEQASSNGLASSTLSTAATLLRTVAGAGLLIPRLGVPDDSLVNVRQASIDLANLGQVQASASANLLIWESQFATANSVLQQSLSGSAALALIQLEQSCQSMCTIVAAQAYLAVASLTMDVP